MKMTTVHTERLLEGSPHKVNMVHVRSGYVMSHPFVGVIFPFSIIDSRSKWHKIIWHTETHSVNWKVWRFWTEYITGSDLYIVVNDIGDEFVKRWLNRD